MKRVSVLILVAALAFVGWALPAGAEKVRLTEDQMDNVSAGINFHWPTTLPVDKSFGFDWGIGTGMDNVAAGLTSSQSNGTGGVGVGAQANGFVQAPCQTAPSLLCMGLMGGGGAMAGPLGAGGGGGGSMNLGNFGGPLGLNTIVQFTGGGGGGAH